SDAGFEPRVAPFNHSELEPGRSGVFVAVRPAERARSARRVQLREAAGHVVAGHRARSDVEPIPAVDRHDRQAQVHQLVLRELLPQALAPVVRATTLRAERDTVAT